MRPLTIGIDLRALTHGLTSGVTTYIHETVSALLKIDQRNHYFLWWNARHDCAFAGKEFTQKNVTLVRTRESNTLLNLNLALRRQPFLDEWIPCAAGKPNMRLDVLWLPDPRPASVSEKCRLVTTIHDLSPTKLPHFFSPKTQIWHRLLDPAALARRSDRVLTPSHTIADELAREWGIYADNIIVTPLGVRADFKRTTNAATLARVRKKYGLPQHFVLALATLEPRKNLALIIRAFEVLKRTTKLPHALVLAGSADKKIFADANLEPRTSNPIFPGFINERDKATLYSAADVFVAASVYEGFDLPVAEAMATGTPFIASDILVHREVARSAAYYFDSDNADALAAALAETLTRPREVKKRVAIGLTLAKKLRWTETAHHTLTTLERAARGKLMRS